MTYSNGYITVPESGIHFIYFNFVSARETVNGGRGPAIYVDSLRIGFSYHHYENIPYVSHYLGMLWNVKKGSKLSVRADFGSMQYFLNPDHSCFGAWKVN